MDPYTEVGLIYPWNFQLILPLMKGTAEMKMDTRMTVMGIGYDAIMITDFIQSGLHQNISSHFTTDSFQ